MIYILPKKAGIRNFPLQLGEIKFRPTNGKFNTPVKVGGRNKILSYEREFKLPTKKGGQGKTMFAQTEKKPALPTINSILYINFDQIKYEVQKKLYFLRHQLF